MSRLARLRITALAAALLAAAPLAGVTAASASAAARPQAQIRPATVPGIGTGSGPTAQKAQKAAMVELRSDFSGCGPSVLVFDDQEPDGTWDAEVSATCAAPQ
jgi:hypothetical protein